ncbi:MAG TPA: histidine utilization repressor [Roseiarcus sp.]|nr:histidine utilization repressor [Roseiarcus sp.]
MKEAIVSAGDPSGADTAPASLHQRILADIEARILSGEWPPGHRIPFEHELTVQYGCSRMTVSKVLTQLAKAGLVARRRKAGTFVTRPHSQAAVLEIHDIKAEAAALGRPYRFEIAGRRKRKLARADERRLDLPASSEALEITCRHFAGSQPFCLEERLINLTAVPEAESETFGELSPGAWLVQRVPWTAAEHRIRATGADRRIAAALALDEGAPCLVIERRTWRAAEPVTYVKLTYPAESHELVARFAPSQR